MLLDPTTLSTEPRDLLPPSPVMLIPPNTVDEGTGLDGTISLELHKQVSEYQINAETKNQNIYSYNLDEKPYTGFKKDNADDMKKVRKRIISYFYDTIFYAEYKKPDKTPEESLNFTIEEIKYIVLQSNFSKQGENEISTVDLDSFDIKYKGTYYDTDQNTILEKIISILEKEAIKIIEDGSKQYLKNTKFNTFIRMPLYEDIETHYRT